MAEEKALLDEAVEKEETCQAEAKQELETLTVTCPDYKTQKTEICAALHQRLTLGEETLMKMS